MKKTIAIILLLFIVAFSSSCKSKAEKEIDDRNVYLQENNITVNPTSSGLYYVEIQEGTDDFAHAGDIVKVHYTGKFLNGDVFDSSYDRGEPIEFTLGIGQVISGWDEGIALMKQGGKATLVIPSNLAYGSNDYHSIPGYSTLVFEVELVKIN